MSEDEHRLLTAALGFKIEFIMKGNPQVVFLDGDGATTGHCRPALRSEARMWCLLTHDPDTRHWHGPPAVRSERVDMGSQFNG